VEDDGDVEVEGEGDGDVSSGAERDDEPDESESHLQVSFVLNLAQGPATFVRSDGDFDDDYISMHRPLNWQKNQSQSWLTRPYVSSFSLCVGFWSMALDYCSLTQQVV